jgi:single-strand DNA-binding protein
MSSLNMPNINQVALSGRLVQDPDFRFVENGAARLSGRIAVNRSYRNRNEEWQEETSFFDIVLWQKAAETFSQRLHKGTPIFATGRLQSHSWRDGEDQPHSRIEVQVRNLQILEKGQEPTDGEEVDTEAALQAA